MKKIIASLVLVLISTQSHAGFTYDWDGGACNAVNDACASATGSVTIENEGFSFNGDELLAIEMTFDGMTFTGQTPVSLLEFFPGSTVLFYAADDFGLSQLVDVDVADDGGIGRWLITTTDGGRFSGDSSSFTLREPTNSVPEPGTLGILGAGILLIGLMRRQQNNKRHALQCIEA